MGVINDQKGSRIFARKSLESNIVVLNRFYDFGEAKITDGRILWSVALFLQITISSNPRYVLSNWFSQNLIYDYLIPWVPGNKVTE